MAIVRNARTLAVMNPKLFRVIVPVSDIERAVAFYETVLGLPGRRVSAGRHYFDCDGTILACFDPAADGDAHESQPNPECRPPTRSGCIWP